MAPRSLTRAVVFPATSTAAGGGAPSDATYITQTANGTLSAEQALASLTTGVLKVTTGTGVLSTATEGTDYYKPGATDVAIADGGTGQSTATLGFNALSPLTTRGDLLTRDASNNVRLAKGTAGQFLTIGANDPVWAAVPAFYMTMASGSATGHSPLDATTYYFATPFTTNPTTNEAGVGMNVPIACTLRRVDIVFGVLGTLGSNENGTLTVRNSTATSDVTLTSTLQMTAATVKTAFTGLSTTYAAGDEIKLKFATPTWATNPTAVFYAATLYFDVP